MPSPLPRLLAPIRRLMRRSAAGDVGALVWLGTALAAGMTLLGAGILLGAGRNPLGAFAGGAAPGHQVLIGVLAGVAAAGVLRALDGVIPGSRGLRDLVFEQFARFRPRPWHLLAISVGAGWGEEYLFRGALQPLIGLWAAAALFALAHGTLSKLSWGRLAYAAVLFLAGTALGALAQWVGLGAAMTAHAAYDFTILMLARREAIRAGVIPT